MSSERRVDPRIEKIHLVQVSRFDEEGFRADLATGRTTNISRGGIRLELYHPLPLRSTVSLNLVLDEQILDVNGRVVYLEDLGDDRTCMGIEFFDLDEETEDLLVRYFEVREDDIKAGRIKVVPET